MKIRKNIIQTLQERMTVEYEKRLVCFLRYNIVRQNRGRVETEIVRKHITEAKSYGLDTERQIAAYVVGVCTFGETFLERIEPLHEQLDDQCVAPDKKAQLLLDQIDALSSLGEHGST